MKNAKKPTRDQRNDIIAAGLDYREWRVVKIFAYQLEVQNIITGQVLRIDKS